MNARLGPLGIDVRPMPDVALLAIQGPLAADGRAHPRPRRWRAPSSSTPAPPIWAVSMSSAFRAGYTGEDGFELAVAAEDAEALARLLLADDRVRPAGLGARDTLRLEAGLCLYGNDLDETTSPVEADLRWTIPKRRRGAADFPGAERILDEWANGPSRVRVGIQPLGRRPVRDHTSLRLPGSVKPIGTVTSGGFGPSVEAPVAMGYVPPDHAPIGTRLIADVRGRDEPCVVASLPFSPHRFHRGA